MRGDEVTRTEPIDPTSTMKRSRLDPERIAGFEGETGAVLDYLRLSDAPPLLVRRL